VTGLFEIIALGFALLALMTWGAVAAAHRKFGSRVAGPWQERILAARAWLYAPVWIPALLITAALLPGFVGLMWPAADHCAFHDQLHHAAHHHHLCLAHPPYASHYTMSALIPLGFLILVVLKAIDGVGRILRERKLGRALLDTSRPSELGTSVRLIDSDEPVALTVGWTRPVVLLSTGLIDKVSAQTLEVILAHETAHQRRRDSLRAFFDHLTAALLPQAVARPLLSSIALAREQACDRDAVQAVGNPVAVARALCEVARLRMTDSPAGLSIASSSLEARIQHLLEPTPAATNLRSRLTMFCVALAILGSYPVHAGIEQLITYVLH
jgi:Zn-dependent protease with chaperone function